MSVLPTNPRTIAVLIDHQHEQRIGELTAGLVWSARDAGIASERDRLERQRAKATAARDRFKDVLPPLAATSKEARAHAHAAHVALDGAQKKGGAQLVAFDQARRDLSAAADQAERAERAAQLLLYQTAICKADKAAVHAVLDSAEKDVRKHLDTVPNESRDRAAWVAALRSVMRSRQRFGAICGGDVEPPADLAEWLAAEFAEALAARDAVLNAPPPDPDDE